jgi:hypothetical protein
LEKISHTGEKGRKASQRQGCQIFLDTIYQKPRKMYQITTTLPNGHKIYHMAVNYSNHQIYRHYPFYVRPSNIYPNWDFWFENKPSGNPGQTDHFFLFKGSFSFSQSEKWLFSIKMEK